MSKYPKVLIAGEVPTTADIRLPAFMIEVGFVFTQFGPETYNVVLPWRNTRLAEAITHDKWSSEELTTIVRDAFESVEWATLSYALNRIGPVIMERRGSPWVLHRSTRKDPTMTVEQLVSLARNCGLGAMDIAKIGKLNPDRLNNGGLNEAIQLLVIEGDDPNWLEDEIKANARTPA